MARTLPADPQFANPTERQVWERLTQQLDDDCIVIANVRLTDEDQDHEADLLVLVPDGGIVTLEVKGGNVSVDEEGRWWQQGRHSRQQIRPVEQLLRTKHAIRRYVEDDPRWGSSGRVRWQHAVVLPYSAVPGGFSLPDLPRTLVIGRDEYTQLRQSVRAIADGHERNFRAPTIDEVEKVATILQARDPLAASVVAASDEREARADRLTQEQLAVLQATRLLHRVEVRGGAGSGKTVLAVAQAKQLTRGFGGVPPQRVALLCYSIGLGEWFKRALARVGRKERPAFVGRFEELGREWGVEITAGRNDSHFWEHELPERMAELARELPDGKKFDAIIVDEAQDFAEDWWAPLLGALRDPDEGGLYVYSDENQALFPRFGRPPVALLPLLLDHNLRNTRQIAESFASLAPMRMRARGGDGPEVEFEAASLDKVLDVADDQVERLRDEGWEASHVALIATGSRHPQQLMLQEELGEDGYWATFWEDDDVFYGHVLGCKGLERRAVVLAVNEDGTRDRGKERLYVGLSRATDRLVVVGDAATVAAMGGPELARELGIT